MKNQNFSVFGMIQHDSKCIFEILNTLLSKKSSNNELNKGLNVFVSTNFLLYISVFVYEILKAIPELKTAIEPNIKGRNFFDNLEKIRNAIHIRTPYGSFEKRSNDIISNMKSEFAGHFDTSLFYRISEPNTVLLGANVFYYHMINDIADKTEMMGIGVKNYAENISSLITAVSKMVKDINYIKPSIDFQNFGLQSINISLFDYTVDSLQEKSKLSTSSFVRVSLMHSYISFMNTLFETINADNIAEVDDYWLFFLAKLYSIGYDEVMDSFDNLSNHCNPNDKAIINDLLDFKGFNRKQNIRDFAQKLRNLIHYGLPNYPPISIGSDYFSDTETVYLNSVELKTTYDFRELFHALRFDMKMMQLRFRRLFDMDYPLSALPLEMARGGKIL